MKRLITICAVGAMVMALGTPVFGAYGVVTSSPLNYSDTGWGGWSVPAGNVVLGGGFDMGGDTAVAASAPGTPGSVWPHYTYGAGEYGWVVQGAPDGQSSPGSNVYAIYDNMPAGYGIAVSSVLHYNAAGGWGGWSVPAGKVVLGGGFVSSNPASAVSVSAPATPGTVWPHYTYGAGEYGWVVQALVGQATDIQIYAIYADPIPGYEVIKSSSLNYSDTGWGGWSVPAGKVVTGGGFQLSAGSASASAPGTPGSVWPHYTYGADEYGWVVQGAADGLSSPGSYVYAIAIPEPATICLLGLGSLALLRRRKK